MKSSLNISVILIAVVFQSCSPLGEPVNEAISDNHYYSPTKEDIIYSSMGNWFELGEDAMMAHVESFQVLNEHLSKDKDRAYYMSYAIKHPLLDLESFHAKTKVEMFHIGLDKNHVYGFKVNDWHDGAVTTLVEGADPKTYIQSDYEWAHDDSSHFYRLKRVNVDYNTFKRVNDHFSLDRDSAYCHHMGSFEGFNVDIYSFKKFDSYLAYDVNNIYCNATYIDGEDVSVLNIIPYSNIDDVIFYDESHIKAVGKVYYHGFEIKSVDLASFEALDYWYAKDKNHVYFENRVVIDADPETFHFSKEDFSYHDKNNKYEAGKIVTNN